MSREERSTNEELTIRLSDIFGFFNRNKWRIGGGALLFGILGAGYSLLQPSEYTSAVKVLPEMQSKSSMGGFRALADLAGINVDNMQVSEAIRPDLYPSVLETRSFFISLAALQVQAADTNRQETISGFLERQKSPMSKWMPSFGSKKDPDDEKDIRVPKGKLPEGVIFLDKKQDDLLKALSGRVSAGLDKKTGIITISAKMPDPVVAAWVAQYAAEYLTDYMLRYRSGKQAEQVDFLRKQTDQAKARFESADRAIRSFRDRNRNPFNSGVVSDESKLTTELSISQNLYAELSRQLEQTTLKMKEETPVIKILESAQVPLKRSEPKRTVITVIWIFVGGFLSTFYCLLKTRRKK